MLHSTFSRLAGVVALLSKTTIIASLGALAVASLSACGGEDAKLLPGETAREITANLDSVKQLSNEGDCVGAESAASQVGEQIEALEGIDRKLKQALHDGAERLSEVVNECEEESEAVARAEIPPPEEEVEAADEATAKKEEKEQEKAAKEQEKEEKKEEKAPPPADQGGPPGHEKVPPGQEKSPPGHEETPSSGGVEPATPAEGDQGD